MNRVGATLTAGVALYAAAACGPETSEAEARVVGFASGIDSVIVQDEWVPYTDQSSLPWSGETRNERHHEEFTGCREVENGFFDLGFDDDECWFDFSCSSTDTTHCKAVYEDRYDYERLETKTVKHCPAPVVITMDKPEQPEIDAHCVEDRGELQRVEQATWYIVSVVVKNPFYDSENNPREMLNARMRVSPEAWASLEPGETIAVTVADNQTVRLG